jgi:tetraacyldisaccharide 4'-kinase
LSGAWPLAVWLARPGAESQPLTALRGQALVAMAGIAVPERFFAALEAAGLRITRLPLSDHHDYRDDDAPPWPVDAPAIVTTEKDAVKLARWAHRGPAIWVVGLDLALPAAFVATLISRLPPPSP